MADISDSETNYFLKTVQGTRSELIDLKTIVMTACANMFTRYMCTVRFDYDCKEYQNVIRYYDEIFWDINQGYAVDFLPWLSPFYTRHMNKLTFWATEIRKFIMENVIEEHLRNINYDAPPEDFTDALLQNLKADPKLNWQHILFELEDFLGGHSAVGNLIMLTLLCMIKFPRVKKKVEEEIEKVTNGTRNVSMLDKAQMTYTEATIFETLRFLSSPIVPHVATEDTQLEGKLYHIRDDAIS
jgi:cytochrome P450 family 307 subfamily A